MLFTTTIALTGDGKRTHSFAVFHISSDQYLKREFKNYFELETEKHFSCSKVKKKIKKGRELNLLTVKESSLIVQEIIPQ